MRYSLDDTIVAISTPIGEGGIGIVRLSGSETVSILSGIFVKGRIPASGERPFGMSPNRLHYGHLVDPDTGETVDEVLASYMPAPQTYTRQDVGEINCHGGVVPLRHILEICLRQGARLAHEGEFTLRAFLNGRIDLAQAEAVLDIVRAKTETGLRVAMGQLGGGLSQHIRAIREELIPALAHLEASIDFPEDEIPPYEVGPAIQKGRERLEQLLSQANRGMIYRHGVRTAIIGRPNVGKSSLLNALLRTSRAIVTPIPGTTRDTLEETINLQGIPLVLIDTAGIVSSDDLIERLSIERSRQALEQADLVLMVVDGSLASTPADEEIAALIGDKVTLLVVNKLDLPQCGEIALLPKRRRAHVSALTGEGLPDLEQALVDLIFGGEVASAGLPLVSNARHEDALKRALQSLCDAQRAQDQNMSEDFVAIDLQAAINALGEITGETASEDLLEVIFSSFCIGK
ncbi:MAG: tRNA uridine-5-carboxymethylaminomethyl(34) synthesis GTPase MnmE [Anaerolineae bacterium]|nr:tRNA uridine-5-carboxymethylaminomethyl(34) synthesis GTPase MnmE [Anaerolineae bacterium]